ncbi:type VI secretion system Vgr family protein [Chryseobacterium luteum]|uniref:Rhs element Vgr protein n=1 Tax=Chryseobacterium luteum TaxID=421531 RepID=A0A085ZBA7_9FLAO|nr:phage baseplate assembly protein V [Chryseobacterium luteum]KFF01721.1 Rhs element Vgr protein [Chryseobacterium luteum]
MSFQETNPKNPLDGGLDGLKQQGLSAAENKITGIISEKLDNPIVNKIAENKDTIKNVVNKFSSVETPIDDASIGRLNHPDDIKKYLSKKTFKDFLKEKDSPLVYCTLTIDGKEFLAKNSYVVELRQHTNDHDTFTIITPDDSLDSFEGYVMENSKNLLGKKVTINFHRYGEVRQSFMGIIANIRNKKNEGGGYGKLFITGYAPSILLENGKDCQSFTEKDLKGIIDEALKEYKNEIPIIAENLNTKYSIPYTVQYKESDYQFIKRLAHRYGEYFYYDGQNLIFGNKVQPIVKLGENMDLIDIEFEIMIKPQGFKYMSYDSISAEVKEKDSDSVQAQYKENGFQAIAVNASKQVFKKKAEMLFNATSQQNVDSDLKEMVLRQKESRESLMQVRGRSRDPQLKIGGRAEISDINAKAMETYRIIEITHSHDGNDYYNEFIGIPDIFISPFFDEDAFPTCEEQSAIVTDNDNPQGMIKVQFPWQKKKGLKTPWLRVVTPYAGKGKGMHIIPEVGEEVVLGFDNGNAERPFVFGAMFNGEASAGLGGAGNFMKGLQTPTGSRLHMNDKDGSLHMQDNGGVSMKFDGGGNATTSAETTKTINVGKGGESILKMDNGGNISLTCNTTITLSTGLSSITLNTDGTILIGGKIIGIGATDGVGINGTKAIDISSKSNHIGGGTTKIDGGDVFIN